MKYFTQVEWDALPAWQAVTYADGSTLFAGYTKGRWPKLYCEGATITSPDTSPDTSPAEETATA